MSYASTLQSALVHLAPGSTLSLTLYRQGTAALLHQSERCARRAGSQEPTAVELQLRASGEHDLCWHCSSITPSGALKVDGQMLGREDAELCVTAAGLIEQVTRVEDAVLPLELKQLGALGEDLSELRIEIEKLRSSDVEIVSELVDLARSHTARLLAELRTQLRAQESEVRAEARRQLLSLRDWDESCELESDEVLIGIEGFYDTSGDSYFLETFLAAFSLRGELEADDHSYVLRAPRFVAELFREGCEARVQTAALPDTPETRLLAAKLWEPGEHTPLASLGSCVSTARDLLALAA